MLIKLNLIIVLICAVQGLTGGAKASEQNNGELVDVLKKIEIAQSKLVTIESRNDELGIDRQKLESRTLEIARRNQEVEKRSQAIKKRIPELRFMEKALQSIPIWRRVLISTLFDDILYSSYRVFESEFAYIENELEVITVEIANIQADVKLIEAEKEAMRKEIARLENDCSSITSGLLILNGLKDSLYKKIDQI